jgi:hypothetical protein
VGRSLTEIPQIVPTVKQPSMHSWVLMMGRPLYPYFLCLIRLHL